jgi:hypothetical protein
MDVVKLNIHRKRDWSARYWLCKEVYGGRALGQSVAERGISRRHMLSG